MEQVLQDKDQELVGEWEWGAEVVREEGEVLAWGQVEPVSAQAVGRRSPIPWDPLVIR
jgi:hypothetical protein